MRQKKMVRQLKGESEGIRRKELDLKLIVRQYGINRTETGMKIEPVFKNKKIGNDTKRKTETYL